MFVPFLLLVVSVVCVIDKQKALPPSEMKFPVDLQERCPHTRFCQLEPLDINATGTREPEGEHSMMPCCEDCSCSPDCGLTRTCCRREFDLYKIDETLGTVCKALHNKVYTKPNEDMYHMVDKCPNKDQTCRAENTSAWGSFSPAYSRSTGMVYYNTQCASCHNKTDLVKFIPFMSCNSFTGTFSNIFSTVHSGVEGECYLQFIIPANIDVSRERCYRFMVRECYNKDALFYHLHDLCQSFNATYHDGFLTYQNVYCYLCRKNRHVTKELWMEHYTMCHSKESRKGLQGLPLSVLLDTDSIDNHAASELETEETHHVCIEEGNSSVLQTCLPVLCPEGHIRVKGQCVMFGQSWYVRNVLVFVNLTTSDLNHNLHVSDLNDLDIQELDSPKKLFVRRSGLRHWKMELLYSTDSSNLTVRYIMAILFTDSRTVVTKTFLVNIQKSLRNKWKLYIKGKIFELKAHFNKFTNYAKSFMPNIGDSEHGTSRPTLEFLPTRMMPGDNRSEEFRLLKLTHISFTTIQPKDLCITKLFFCEQVHLPSSMFIPLSSDEAYLVRNRKHLGSGEFTTTDAFRPDGMPNEIRVCLSDFMDDVSTTSRNLPYATLLLMCQTFLNFYLM